MSKTLRLHHSLPLGGGNLRHWLYHPMSLQLLNLDCFFLSSLPPLTQFHNLPPLGDIIISTHFLFFIYLFFCHVLASIFIWLGGSEPSLLYFLIPSFSTFPKGFARYLDSAILSDFFLYGLAGPISSDRPPLLKRFLLSQPLGTFVQLPCPGTAQTPPASFPLPHWWEPTF